MGKPKPKSAPQTLSDRSIRAALLHLTQSVMSYGARLRVLEVVLLEKGLVTESEMLEAKARVYREGQDEIAKIAAASHLRPPGGIQTQP